MCISFFSCKLYVLMHPTKNLNIIQRNMEKEEREKKTLSKWLPIANIVKHKVSKMNSSHRKEKKRKMEKSDCYALYSIFLLSYFYNGCVPFCTVFFFLQVVVLMYFVTITPFNSLCYYSSFLCIISSLWKSN